MDKVGFLLHDVKDAATLCAVEKYVNRGWHFTRSFRWLKKNTTRYPFNHTLKRRVGDRHCFQIDFVARHLAEQQDPFHLRDNTWRLLLCDHLPPRIKIRDVPAWRAHFIACYTEPFLVFRQSNYIHLPHFSNNVVTIGIGSVHDNACKEAEAAKRHIFA